MGGHRRDGLAVPTSVGRALSSGDEVASVITTISWDPDYDLGRTLMGMPKRRGRKLTFI